MSAVLQAAYFIPTMWINNSASGQKFGSCKKHPFSKPPRPEPAQTN
jgi:hypothetical protein